ncbi:peptidase U62 modulator of DNA gyrase [[Leptolyngbya] sp. PCC 7376]|uniref:TldD/PmbA family protein n=1 Tax=[Leptolyngbya] sp. PCC 7376 TaxID=111781 RepID=UPI00029F3680|nr:TldD/PmbA family protein [[Leptolyngbya] sp. PCC 7376]AFY36863.1 peptidase U62 modulator of DNA gyrase [[Leptolyngbya] sp. PCC 7376]
MVATAPRLISQEQAFDWVDKIIARAESDGVSVYIEERESALGRFGENQIRQNLQKNQFEIRITSYFKQQSASVTTVAQDLDGIISALRRSEDLARVAPADPEWIPLLEPQTYVDFSAKFDEATYSYSPLERGELIQKVCQQSAAAGTEGSGILSTSATAYALGNSAGLRAYDKKTNAEFSFTAKIGNGSSWGSRTAWGLEELPIEQIVATTLQRATMAQNPTRLEPDTYPVVFGAGAIANLIPRMIWNMSARSADEGRSFFSGEEGSNRLGEKLFNDKVNLYRDPNHPLFQFSAFSSGGLPGDRLPIIEAGVVKNLNYDRYWATQKNCAPNGSFFPLVMAGTDQTLADLIAGTERGIFVNRAWYVQSVNRKTLELTGMTRDGAFWIENGKLAQPIYNLRFNETLPNLLNNIEAIATPERHGSSVVPAIKTSAFHFSSVTDSI